jgi:hypothetical protein
MSDAMHPMLTVSSEPTLIVADKHCASLSQSFDAGSALALIILVISVPAKLAGSDII